MLIVQIAANIPKYSAIKLRRMFSMILSIGYFFRNTMKATYSLITVSDLF